MDERHWEATTYTALGANFNELGRYADAAASARHALRMEDNSDGKVKKSGTADYVLGRALVHLGDFTAAFAHLHRSLEIIADEFSRGYALTYLGSAYLRVGDIDNAVRTSRRAVEHCRGVGHRLGEATSLNDLGAALYASGDVEEARKAWQSALAVLEELGHPDAETVRTHLNTLDDGTTSGPGATG
ncbi:tetratricopeptide repeat protein [Saccharopolyspora elongata]|uniref:Tetratricopeptide repeat protein n=1 Tax=Saccharopolyspora elongata TaxID=2530387 RepID=A0A4R4ZEB8_9PSEU|nr:tetratricopeptide repeat protein [Saccharopolyspora elongata]TDD55649.1 tetratricopeptide repeat protein [Saccharopolyspora elongata]